MYGAVFSTFYRGMSPCRVWVEADILTSVPHYFYFARCADGSLYAGTCLDLKAREEKHNDGTGAKYTRSRLPIKIVYSEEFETLSEARSREAKVKRLKKSQKEALLPRKKVQRTLGR